MGRGIYEIFKNAFQKQNGLREDEKHGPEEECIPSGLPWMGRGRKRQDKGLYPGPSARGGDGVPPTPSGPLLGSGTTWKGGVEWVAG